jgi:hypothetical protein
MENMYSHFKVFDKWKKRLKFFRYEQAYDGHVSDTNRLVLTAKYYGQDDLINFFDELRVAYERFESQPNQPEPTKSYSLSEFRKFPSLIPKTRWIRQPSDQVINSVKVNLWCTEETVEFTIRASEANKYELVEADFENAEKIEKLFSNYGERVKNAGNGIR